MTTNKRRLDRLAQLVNRRTPDGREWTPENAVHQDEAHVLEVLRTLRDVGALGDVLKDERLELEALELLAGLATTEHALPK